MVFVLNMKNAIGALQFANTLVVLYKTATDVVAVFSKDFSGKT